MEASFMMVWLIVLGGGGGNELLDYIPSKVFWQIDRSLIMVHS